MLLTILAFIVVIGILITIHEFGHFITAKMFGIRVLVFSLGFGPKIISWKGKETEYRLAIIPLGGYVKMAGQEAILEGKPIEEGDFYSRSPWKRILVVFGGPLMNLILAFLIFFSVMLIGSEQLVFKPVVGDIVEELEVEGVLIESPAHKSELMVGDKFIRINDVEVTHWGDLQEVVFASDGDECLFVVEREGEIQELEITPVYDEGTERWMIGVSPEQDNLVSIIIPGSPAEKAGLKEGDRILYLNEERVETWAEIVKAFEGVDKKVKLTVDRNGKKELISIELDEKVEDVMNLGFITGLEKISVRVGPGGALIKAFDQTVFMTTNTLKGIVFLIIGKISPTEAIGGPLTIADYAGKSVRAGWESFLNYIAILSILLFVINLFPIPVLDGGNILLSIIEGIKRAPVGVKFRMVFQHIGLVFLLGVMLFAIVMDLIRYVF